MKALEAMKLALVAIGKQTNYSSRSTVDALDALKDAIAELENAKAENAPVAARPNGDAK